MTLYVYIYTGFIYTNTVMGWGGRGGVIWGWGWGEVGGGVEGGGGGVAGGGYIIRNLVRAAKTKIHQFLHTKYSLYIFPPLWSIF